MAWHTFNVAICTSNFVLYIRYAIANAGEIDYPSLQYKRTFPFYIF